MKTVIGSYILKRNSKMMSDLTQKLVVLAKELESLPKLKAKSGSTELQIAADRNTLERYGQIMAEYKENRKQWQSLQDEITALVGIEQWLNNPP